MLHQYYFNRLRLFRLPYRMLLAYHCPAGNPIRMWTSYHMTRYILGIRQDIHILSMGTTVIQIRKALNTLYKRINTRGTLLIYAQAFNRLKMHHGTVFSFITDWVPGILTNYKQLVKTLMSLSAHRHKIQHHLSRNQCYWIANTSIRTPFANSLRGKLPRRYPAIPSITCSITDSFVFLNESLCLGIPAINVCDTQSIYHKVSLPIIANQKSTSFISFLVNLFVETCSYALLSEHSTFVQSTRIKPTGFYPKCFGVGRKISFLIYRYHLLKPSFKKRRSRKVKLRLLTTKELIRYHKYPISLARQSVRKHYKRLRPIPVIRSRTFIFNNRLFAYQIREVIKYSSTNLAYIRDLTCLTIFLIASLI
jgi:ribosomal protein S2